jgi:hypothetical protein
MKSFETRTHNMESSGNGGVEIVACTKHTSSHFHAVLEICLKPRLIKMSLKLYVICFTSPSRYLLFTQVN